ncbi:hypothetical protein E2C01_052123 [Portunus trituberculatus]|uniref:Uncharacterized protein n=1 Tax=Portunus trituberculatus TaxID=210409 RepID=A0A5B7GM66_PORTR|nr:hypothetical protein [Portunus trituberculatus]
METALKVRNSITSPNYEVLGVVDLDIVCYSVYGVVLFCRLPTRRQSASNTAWRDSCFARHPACLCLTGCPVLQCCDPLLWSLHSQSYFYTVRLQLSRLQFSSRPLPATKFHRYWLPSLITPATDYQASKLSVSL